MSLENLQFNMDEVDNYPEVKRVYIMMRKMEEL